MLTAVVVNGDPSQETQVARDDKKREVTDQGHMLSDSIKERGLYARWCGHTMTRSQLKGLRQDYG